MSIDYRPCVGGNTSMLVEVAHRYRIGGRIQLSMLGLVNKILLRN